MDYLLDIWYRSNGNKYLKAIMFHDSYKGIIFDCGEANYNRDFFHYGILRIYLYNIFGDNEIKRAAFNGLYSLETAHHNTDNFTVDNYMLEGIDFDAVIDLEGVNSIPDNKWGCIGNVHLK